MTLQEKRKAFFMRKRMDNKLTRKLWWLRGYITCKWSLIGTCVHNRENRSRNALGNWHPLIHHNKGLYYAFQNGFNKGRYTFDSRGKINGWKKVWRV